MQEERQKREAEERERREGILGRLAELEKEQRRRRPRVTGPAGLQFRPLNEARFPVREKNLSLKDFVI